MFRESWIFYKLRGKSIIGGTDFQTSYSQEEMSSSGPETENVLLSEYSRTSYDHIVQVSLLKAWCFKICKAIYHAGGFQMPAYFGKAHSDWANIKGRMQIEFVRYYHQLSVLSLHCPLHVLVLFALYSLANNQRSLCRMRDLLWRDLDQTHR